MLCDCHPEPRLWRKKNLTLLSTFDQKPWTQSSKMAGSVLLILPLPLLPPLRQPTTASASISTFISMGASNFFPFGNVGHVDARADHVFQGGSSLSERGFDVADGLYRLRASIAHSDDASVWSSRCRSGNRDAIADAHGARVTDNRLPRRSARDILPVHLRFSLGSIGFLLRCSF